MIQRIQTVYLALAGILLIIPVLLNLNWATAESAEGVAFALNSTQIVALGDNVEALESAFPIAGAVALALLLTIYGIMQYKDRKFQMRLVQIALILQPVIGGLIYFYSGKLSSVAENASASFSPFLTIFLVNVILYFLAFRGIKKDDELVRSADRLR